ILPKIACSVLLCLLSVAALADTPAINHKLGGSVSIPARGLPQGAQYALVPGGPYLQSSIPLKSSLQAMAVQDNHAYIAAGDTLLIFGLAADSPPKLLAQARSQGKIVHMALSDGYAYLTSSTGMLQIVDVQDPQRPQLLADYSLEHPPVALSVEQGRAYLASGKQLTILDVSRPQSPQWVARLALHSEAVALDVVGGYAYLALAKSGLAVLDVHEPGNVREAGNFRGDVRDVVVADGKVYLANGATGLTLLDASDPQALRWLGSINRIGNALSLNYGSGYVALRNDRSEISLIDVRNPKLPKTVATYRAEHPIDAIALAQKQVLSGSGALLETINFSTPAPAIVDSSINFGGSRRAVIRDNILYVADWFSGLHLYDISDPASLRHLSAYHTPGSPKGVAVRGNYAYVGDDDHGVQIIDISKPKHPRKVSEIATPGLAYAVKLAGDYLYLADHRGGFHIINIADPVHPTITGSARTADRAWSVELDGAIAYVAADTAGLLVFDVSDPRQPRQIAAYNTGGAAEEVVVRDRLAYVASFENGMHILDISNPAEPRAIGHLPTPGNARGIELAGNIAYISDWVSGIQVADISDPAKPRLIGSHDTDGWPWGMLAQGSHAFVLDWWGGISVLDISSPASPTPFSTYHLRGTTRDITIKDGFAYVASGNNGLQIFDVNTPQYPIWMAGIDVAGEAQSVWLENKTVYLAAGAGGLFAIDVSNPFEPQKTRRYTVQADRGGVDLVRTHGKLVFAANRQHGIAIIDAASGQQVGVYDAKIKDLWPADDGRLLIATQNGIEVVDISNPENPRRLQRLPQRAGLVRLQGKVLALYDHTSGISFYEYPRLKQIGRFNPAEEIYDMKLSGNRLYASGSKSGLLVLDISDAQNPALAAAYPAAAGATGLSEFSGVIFLAGNEVLASVRLLPDTAVNAGKNSSITINAPPKLPLGSYHLLALDARNGKRAMQHDAVHVVMPVPKSPPFSMQDFERIMKERGLTPMQQ
ncbi:MAG: hypothetical protein OEV35_03560, partial [Gallionellaceae bacterium]|nr:hypothetical protein [Gallionellaceae bacterium]